MSRFITNLAVSTAIFFLATAVSATESTSSGAEFCASADYVAAPSNPFEPVPLMSPFRSSDALERLPAVADLLPLLDQFEAESVLATRTTSEPLATTSRFQALTTYALTYLGNRYKYGGNNPSNGIDCSGFVKYVFNKVGVDLPRTAQQQASVGAIVRKSELKLGDLVFFNTLGRSLSHVGIYLGNGDFVHASGVKRGIQIDTLSTGYFAARFEGGRSIR